MSSKMYALIDQNTFHLNIAPANNTSIPQQSQSRGSKCAILTRGEVHHRCKICIEKELLQNADEHLPCVQ